MQVLKSGGRYGPLEFTDPKSSPVVHLTQYDGVIYLACKNGSLWEGISSNREDVISGSAEDIFVREKTVSWPSLSGAKRTLRNEFGPDTGFIVKRENRFRTSSEPLPKRRIDAVRK